METKTCWKCHETKPWGCFGRDKTRKDGLNCTCKSCARENSRRYNLDNRAEALEKKRAWRVSNPGKAKARDTRNSAWSRQKLKPAYVAKALGMPVKQVTPELLELKREQLTYHRLLKEAKTILKDMK